MYRYHFTKQTGVVYAFRSLGVWVEGQPQRMMKEATCLKGRQGRHMGEFGGRKSTGGNVVIIFLTSKHKI